jgi:hypothetical protein
MKGKAARAGKQLQKSRSGAEVTINASWSYGGKNSSLSRRLSKERLLRG